MSELLRLENVWAGYGDAVVLEDLSLSLAAGESLALLGRNGMGKTTLLATLMGVTRLRRGRIVFQGEDIAQVPSHRRAQAGLGWVPQERDIFRSLTVEENLTVVARPGEWTLERVYALFPRLQERRTNLGSQLSGGEQQMLAMGRALMLNPKILLLDEPLEGLAPLIAQELLHIIDRMVSEGRMAAEVVPVSVPQKRGDAIVVAQDEGIRADTTLESLSKLRAIQRDGTVTAGNAAQQNDAAAACLVVAEDKLAELNLTPDAFLVGWAAAGCEPAEMGIGPVPAAARLMKRLGLSVDDMDLVEINEAFACQVLSVLQAWPGVDPERVNVNGSGISLGHPIGATGVRIMTTLLHEMKRRNVRYGLETMCIGGGQGMAAMFERA